jgi:hypothetical protein
LSSSAANASQLAGQAFTFFIMIPTVVGDAPTALAILAFDNVGS